MGYGDLEPWTADRGHHHRDHDELPRGRLAGARRLRLRPRLPDDGRQNREAAGTSQRDSDVVIEIAGRQQPRRPTWSRPRRNTTDRAEPRRATSNSSRSSPTAITTSSTSPARRCTSARRKRPAAGSSPLDWGEGLLSFKPEANLAGQISGVEVYGWDPKTKKAIVGRAAAGEEVRPRPEGQQRRRLPERTLEKPARPAPAPAGVHPGRSDQARARHPEQRAKQFLTGEGETIGLPSCGPIATSRWTTSGAVLEDLLHPAGDPQDRHQRLSHALQGEGDDAMNLLEMRRAKPRTKPAATSRAWRSRSSRRTRTTTGSAA